MAGTPKKPYSASYLKRLNRLKAKGLTPYQARKQSGLSRGLSPQAAIGKQKKGEFNATIQSLLKREGGFRKHPELYAATKADEKKRVKAIEALNKYYASTGGKRNATDRALHEIKIFLDDAEKEEIQISEWKGLKVPPSVPRKFKTLIGLVLRPRGWWVMNLETGTTLDGPFDKEDDALEALHEIISDYDSLSWDED